MSLIAFYEARNARLHDRLAPVRRDRVATPVPKPATAPISGKLGDWVVFDYFNEGTQFHPMHLHRFDLVVGFPLDSPYTVDTRNVAPGERYPVLVNLDTPGTWVWHCHILPHVEKDDGMFGMVTAVVVK